MSNIPVYLALQLCSNHSSKGIVGSVIRAVAKHSHSKGSSRVGGSWYYRCCFFCLHCQQAREKIGIENLSQSDSIRGTMEIEGGMTVARDKSLPRVVAEAKLANVIAATGNGIMRELSKSTKE